MRLRVNSVERVRSSSVPDEITRIKGACDKSAIKVEENRDETGKTDAIKIQTER